MDIEHSPSYDLKKFDVDRYGGFLLSNPPMVNTYFGDDFMLWTELGNNLPKLLAAQKVKNSVQRLIPMSSTQISSNGAWERAMRLLSFIAHAYIWENWKEKPETVLPANIAVPWYHIAKSLGRPPVLSYASYALDNWALIDLKGPIELGNIYLLQNFLGGLDEEWFILVHVEIEAKMATALCAVGPAQEAVLSNNLDELEKQLNIVATAQNNIYKTLCRMTENCDPYIYYNRVRPYITGFDRHPVIYDSVAEYGGRPQTFHGETGAQSSIVPTLDALLGIIHEYDATDANSMRFKLYLESMLDYMPPRHRAFIRAVAQGPSIRECIYRNRSHQSLIEAFNECVSQLWRFRKKHLEYVVLYIQGQKEVSPHNSIEYGTGGTPFMLYLKKHVDETGNSFIR